MAAGLNLRNIGETRKTALKAEAEARGVSVAELMREWIDEGLKRARAVRARDAFLREAGAGLEDETNHLREHGPTLARFRSIARGQS